MNSQTQFAAPEQLTRTEAAIQRVGKAILLSHLKVKRRPIDLPQCGRVYARGLTPEQVSDLQDKAKGKEFYIHLLIATIVDDHGTPYFAEEDIDELRTAGNAELDPLINEALIAIGFKKAPEAKNS